MEYPVLNSIKRLLHVVSDGFKMQVWIYILNTQVGKEISFDEVIAMMHFLVLGAENPRKANVANENANGVFMAIDFTLNPEETFQ